MPATAPPIPATAPRVLLFGHPGSGKSSLLGALLRASDTQPDTLEAEIVDPERSLDHIRDSVYGGGHFHQLRTDVIRHVIEVHPLADEGEPPPTPYQVVLLDCDGSAAGSLLKHPDSIYLKAGLGTVAQAVVESDAMLLAVNAGEDDDELQRHFEDFQLFLERVHGRKTRAYEVGGFPIYLVLTQCDRLAVESDTTAKWQKHVAEHLEYVLAKFADFLEDTDSDADSESPYLPFGSVDLHGYAVAVQRPELSDAPDPPAEPYGVAELFRDCLAAARDHRQRVTRSDLRLWWTVRSVLFAVLFMAFGVGAMLTFQPAPADTGLLDRVRLYREKEPPAADRLSVKHINRNEEVLRGFRSDGGFERLPNDLRQFVLARLEEIDAYRGYRKSLLNPNTPIPADARTLEELNHIAQRLTSDLTPPPQWADTEAAAIRDKWLADVELIRRAEDGWTNWYWGLANAANERARSAAFDNTWREAVANVLTSADRPIVRDILIGATDAAPVRLADPIPGSTAVPHVPKPRGDPVTFQVPYSFDRVYVANQSWTGAKARLTRLRDLADVLGLTPGPQTAAPALYGVLDIPAPDPRINSRTLAGERLAMFSAGTSTVGDPIAEWAINQFDDPARSKLADRIERSSRNGAAHFRTLLEAELGRPTATATAADWSRVAQSLEGKPELRECGRLLHLLARLKNPSAPDPVAELAAFLRKPEFILTISKFELIVSVNYKPRGKPVTVTDSLVVMSGSRSVKFKLIGQEERGTTTVFQFEREGDGKVVYHPGEELRIAVPVALGDNVPTEFVWAEGGLAAFQFERLRSPPIAKLVQPGVEPRLTDGVKLTVSGAIPSFPALFPIP